MNITDYASAVGKHITLKHIHTNEVVNGMLKSVLMDHGNVFEVLVNNNTRLFSINLYTITAVATVESDITSRAYKAQEDFYLPVTQQRVKLDPKITAKLYDLLADSCTDEKGYTDLPAMIAYLSNLIVVFINDVQRDMGEDVSDEVVTLLKSMLPESQLELQDWKTVERQVLEHRESPDC